MSTGTLMIEETIDLVLRSLPQRSSGANLSGFLQDCDFYFSQPEELIASVDARTTGDPRSMVSVTLTLGDHLPSVQGVSKLLRKAWDEVAYRAYQAASIRWYREGIILRFVTASPGSGLLVTGTVVAQGGGYAQVVATYDREFGSLHGLLKSWSQ